jgi:hypothetical protein
VARAFPSRSIRTRDEDCKTSAAVCQLMDWRNMALMNLDREVDLSRCLAGYGARSAAVRGQELAHAVTEPR